MELKFSPHHAFCEAVQECLGSSASARFLEAYWIDVEQTPYTFLSRLIRGWVTVPFDKTLAFEPDDEIGLPTLDPDAVSIMFLLKVEAERFLEFTYFDLLGRPLGEADVSGYQGMDFSSGHSRIAVLNAVLQSPEAAGRALKVVSEDDYKHLMEEHKLGANGRMHLLANGVLMGKTAGLGSYDRKFPLLWKAHDTGSLFCAFGMVANIKAREGQPVSESDWIFFGPKAPLAKGQYNLRIDIACDTNDLFHFDVVHGGGTKALSSMKFFGAIDTKLLITLQDDVDDIEIRLANLNGRPVPIDIKEVSLAPVII